MNIGTPNQYPDAEAAARAMLDLRQYKPFQYGGKWLVGIDESGQAFAYRNQRDVTRRMDAAARGLEGYKLAIIS